MSQHAELHLKAKHVRAVNRLDVAVDDTSDPPIQLDPTTASVVVGGGTQSQSGEVVVRNTAGTDVLSLTETDEAGHLEVRDSGAEPVVVLDGSGQNQTSAIEVRRSGRVAAAVDIGTNGGRVAVRNTLQSEDAVSLEGSGSGGRIAVTKVGGDPTCEIVGEDAAVLLNDDQQSGLSAAGGGELVVGNVNGTTDVHVHATGKFNSTYGLGNGNRPRIYLNGPEASMELGRDRQSNGAESVNGEVVMCDDHGNPLLELRATNAATSEIVMRWSDGTSVDQRARIEGGKQGLMIYDANGNEALLIAKNGEIRTAKQVSNTL